MLHRLRIIAVLPLILTLLLAACGSDEDATSTPSGGGSADPTGTAEPSPTDESDATPSPDSTALVDTSWVLVELDGQPPLTGSEITLSFEDGEISGLGGCNTYGGNYAAGDRSLSIETLMITEMGCAEPVGVLEQEQVYVDALVQAASYRLDAGSNRLEILDEASEVRIVFTNQAEPNGTEEPVATEGTPKGGDEPVGTGNLDGTGWVLTHIEGQEVDPDPPATLIFWASQYSGEYGCLTYFGKVSTADKPEIFDTPLYSHDQPCERAAGPDLSDTYMAALDRIRQYQHSSNRLDLLDEIGKIVLTYRPAVTDQSGLDNTSWILVDLDGAPLIADTEITLSFSNWSASGNAGCNGYGSPYTVPAEGIISMPEIVSTDAGCPEPPGVQEQETAYLQTLYGVTGYRLTDNRLELTNEAGDVVLVYQPVGEEQSSLKGTSWDLVTMNGSSLVDGSETTLSFSNGWVEGNGGCNDYGRENVIPADGAISIPDVSTNEEDCMDPPGILDQEYAYYDALSKAVTYRITDSTLELINEAGEATLVFERQATGN